MKMCVHYAKKGKCRICDRKNYCEHDNLKTSCKLCNPKGMDVYIKICIINNENSNKK